MAYENNQIKPVLSLPVGTNMRLQKIEDVQGDTITTSTEIDVLLGMGTYASGIFKIQGNEQHAKFVDVGFYTHPTEIFDEHPVKYTREQALKFWNKEVFGSENP